MGVGCIDRILAHTQRANVSISGIRQYRKRGNTYQISETYYGLRHGVGWVGRVPPIFWTGGDNPPQFEWTSFWRKYVQIVVFFLKLDNKKRKEDKNFLHVIYVRINIHTSLIFCRTIAAIGAKLGPLS